VESDPEVCKTIE